MCVVCIAIAQYIGLKAFINFALKHFSLVLNGYRHLFDYKFLVTYNKSIIHENNRDNKVTQKSFVMLLN